MGKTKLQILSRNDIEKIHKASIKILEKTGAQFLNNKALDYLGKYGCQVDRKTKIVKIPEAVVKEFMKKAIQEYPYYNRYLKKIPKRDAYLQTFRQGTYMTDREGVARPSTLKDVEKVSIVGNALESIDRPIAAVAARDISPDTACLHEAFVNWNQISNPNKAIMAYGGTEETMKAIIEMGAALAGGIEELRKTPVVYGGICPTSPLVWPGPGLGSMMLAAENGLNNETVGMATSGSMAPMSLAGTLAVHNAEMLSFEVFCQMVAYDAGFKGAVAKMGCSSSILDVRKGFYPVGNPESALLNAAAAELAQYYKCPSRVAGA